MSETAIDPRALFDRLKHIDGVVGVSLADGEPLVLVRDAGVIVLGYKTTVVGELTPADVIPHPR